MAHEPHMQAGRVRHGEAAQPPRPSTVARHASTGWIATACGLAMTVVCSGWPELHSAHELHTQARRVRHGEAAQPPWPSTFARHAGTGWIATAFGPRHDAWFFPAP